MKKLSAVLVVVLGLALMFSIVGMGKQDILCKVTGGLQLGITEQAVAAFPFLEGASKANVGFNVRCLPFDGPRDEACGTANLVIHYDDKDNPNYETYGPVAKWQGSIEGDCLCSSIRKLFRLQFNVDIGGNTYEIFVALADRGSPGTKDGRVLIGDTDNASLFPIIGGNVVYH